MPANDPLRKRLTQLAASADKIRSEIVATKEGGAITGEERLREFLTEVYGDVNGYYGPPTAQQVERTEVLGRELEDVIKKLPDTSSWANCPPSTARWNRSNWGPFKPSAKPIGRSSIRKHRRSRKQRACKWASAIELTAGGTDSSLTAEAFGSFAAAGRPRPGCFRAEVSLV